MGRVRDNGLALFFAVLFVGSLVGQAIAGHAAYNADQLAHSGETISLWRYLSTSSFGQAVMENWQSEYLQFVTFIVAATYFIQRGSTESKQPGKEGHETDEEQKVGEHADEQSPRWARAAGLRRWLFSYSLVLVMLAIFLASWFAQSVTGWSDYNAEQLEHGEEAVNWLGFVRSATFWESTLQNWQSEFLAVASMAVLSVYLRQRGSPESKPVGAPHDATAQEG
jgi:membrane protein implicated in regulation of membrane protease activity